MLRNSRGWLDANVAEEDRRLVATQIMIWYREHTLYAKKEKEDREKPEGKRHAGSEYMHTHADGKERPLRRWHRPATGSIRKEEAGAHAFLSCITCCGCAGKSLASSCDNCRKPNHGKVYCKTGRGRWRA
jgi:hypothetical protein